MVRHDFEQYIADTRVFAIFIISISNAVFQLADNEFWEIHCAILITDKKQCFILII